MENLIEIKKKASQMKSSDFESFNQYFNAKQEVLEPLDKWATEMFLEACKKTNRITIEEIHDHVLQVDMTCSFLFRLPEDEQDEARKKHFTFFEDDEIFVTASIDYDCGTTFCKYRVKRKSDGLIHGNALDLGNR